MNGGIAQVQLYYPIRQTFLRGSAPSETIQQTMFASPEGWIFLLKCPVQSLFHEFGTDELDRRPSTGRFGRLSCYRTRARVTRVGHYVTSDRAVDPCAGKLCLLSGS